MKAESCTVPTPIVYWHICIGRGNDVEQSIIHVIVFAHFILSKLGYFQQSLPKKDEKKLIFEIEDGIHFNGFCIFSHTFLTQNNVLFIVCDLNTYIFWLWFKYQISSLKSIMGTFPTVLNFGGSCTKYAIHLLLRFSKRKKNLLKFWPGKQPFIFVRVGYSLERQEESFKEFFKSTENSYGKSCTRLHF